MLRLLSKTILWMMGWYPLNQQLIDMIAKHKRLVCVFSHTSYYDFIMMVLYYLAYPEYLRNLRTLITPVYFDRLSWLLRLVGGMRAPPLYVKYNGTVLNIIKELKEMDNVYFLISPKGTILRSSWRTGYYYIAQGLECPLIALGMDYERKEVGFGNLVDQNLDETLVRDKLVKDLAEIVPLYDQEVVEIRKHKKSNVTVLSQKSKIGIYMIIILFFNFIR